MQNFKILLYAKKNENKINPLINVIWNYYYELVKNFLALIIIINGCPLMEKRKKKYEILGSLVECWPKGKKRINRNMQKLWL